VNGTNTASNSVALIGENEMLTRADALFFGKHWEEISQVNEIRMFSEIAQYPENDILNTSEINLCEFLSANFVSTSLS
jgi:hypothetical protein